MMEQITFPKIIVAIGVAFYILSPTWGSVVVIVAGCALIAQEAASAISRANDNSAAVYERWSDAFSHVKNQVSDLEDRTEMLSKQANLSALAMHDIQKIADDTKQMLTQSKISAALKRQ